MSENIDWTRVGKNLRCPICGEKAYLVAGTDGTEGEHVHRFQISRAEAMRLSRPDPAEVVTKIAELESEIRRLRAFQQEHP